MRGGGGCKGGACVQRWRVVPPWVGGEGLRAGGLMCESRSVHETTLKCVVDKVVEK